MNVKTLKEGDSLQYIDKTGIVRRGIVLRNRTTDSVPARLFLTVQDQYERVEVLRDANKVIG